MCSQSNRSTAAILFSTSTDSSAVNCQKNPLTWNSYVPPEQINAVRGSETDAIVLVLAPCPMHALRAVPPCSTRGLVANPAIAVAKKNWKISIASIRSLWGFLALFGNFAITFSNSIGPLHAFNTNWRWFSLFLAIHPVCWMFGPLPWRPIFQLPGAGEKWSSPKFFRG